MATTTHADTSTMSDVQLFMLEDFEFEVPCDGRPGVKDCDKPAEWLLLFSCGCDRTHCDSHKEVAVKWSQDGTLYCLTCTRARSDTTVKKVILVEPIRGNKI